MIIYLREISITIGEIKFNKKKLPNTLINIPLKTLHRHGLVSGDIVTGKKRQHKYFRNNF